MSNQIEIDNFKNKLLNKIFNIYEYDDQKYFIDVENKLIWDIQINIVGIINNDEKIFFKTIDDLILEIESDMENIIKININEILM